MGQITRYIPFSALHTYPFAFSNESDIVLIRGGEAGLTTVDWTQGGPPIENIQVSDFHIQFARDTAFENIISQTGNAQENPDYWVGDQNLGDIFSLENIVDTGDTGTLDVSIDPSGISESEIGTRIVVYYRLYVDQPHAHTDNPADRRYSESMQVLIRRQHTWDEIPDQTYNFDGAFSLDLSEFLPQNFAGTIRRDLTSDNFPTGLSLVDGEVVGIPSVHDTRTLRFIARLQGVDVTSGDVQFAPAPSFNVLMINDRVLLINDNVIGITD